MASDWLGVSIAPDDDMLTASPTWERLDSGVEGLRVSGIQIKAGRQSEFEETGTGTCTVTFNDMNGILDPTNSSSPLFGTLLSRPFAIAIRNPITDQWWPLFRGAVDDVQLDLNKAKVKHSVTLTAVDAFDYFANFELVPGLAGFVHAQTNAAGYVFYEDAQFQDRMFAILEDCGWPAELSVPFSGNVIVDECIYSPGDSALQALFECVDAEFPSVANMFVDKRGRLMALGRYARFDPDFVDLHAVNWTFNRWKAGDNAQAILDPERAKMQPPFVWSESRKTIYNAALAYPQTADRADLADYVVVDAASRAEHGTRTWTAENLKILEGGTTGNTAKEECMLYAEHIVTNHAAPQPRIETFTVGTEGTHTDYAPAVWDLLCEAQISDVIEIGLENPGGGEFTDVEFYVEGLSYDIRPGPGSLDESYPFVKMNADLSPAAHWGVSPFPSPTT